MLLTVLLAAFCTVFLPLLTTGENNRQAFAMEAPGNGAQGWVYRDYHWFYYDDEEARIPHTGWLSYGGDWYWFDENGWMQSGGYRDIDGARYYFYLNGHLVHNQYLGLEYYDEKGLRDDTYDIRVVGSKKPDNMDRDLITDDLYNVPRSWIRQFVQDGWQFMFYKKKAYFEAPDTGSGIYYVYHSTDTWYKKAKFTETAGLLPAFGEYVGYAAGCYKKNNAWMQRLWKEYAAVENILEIPDYYANDAKYVFGQLFTAYVGGEKREELIRASSQVCEVLDEILMLHEDEETKTWLKKQREEEDLAAAIRAERIAQEEGYGPGVPRPTEPAEESSGERQEED